MIIVLRKGYSALLVPALPIAGISARRVSGWFLLCSIQTPAFIFALQATTQGNRQADRSVGGVGSGKAADKGRGERGAGRKAGRKSKRGKNSLASD